MKIFVFFALLTLGACSGNKSNPTPTGIAAYPNGVVVSNGNGSATIYPLKLPDGTRCAALIGYNKGALSCDWANSPKTP